MLKRLSKVIAITLCISLFFSQTAYLAAAANTTQVDGQLLIAEKDNTPLDTPKVSTIPEGNIYIPANTTLDVILKVQISSKKNKVGDSIDFETAENLIINGVVVIPKGSIGKAVITEARKAGGLGRKGKLAMEAVSVKTQNGVEVPLSCSVKNAGKTDGGAVAVFAVVSIVGGIFMKGTNVTYPAGSHFTVTVKRDTDLGATNENLAKVMESNRPQGKSITVGQ